MKEMNGFHPLEVGDTKNPTTRMIDFWILNPQSKV
jgi:hypothetical protein